MGSCSCASAQHSAMWFPGLVCSPKSFLMLAGQHPPCPVVLLQAQLGLAHAFSRSKVKFNVNRVDNMIIQARRAVCAQSCCCPC